MLDHPVFQTAPTLAQCAKDGRWENAWAFTSETLPSKDAVSDFLERGREMAFEVFFGQAFLGVRFEGEPEAVNTFALACVEAYKMARDAKGFFDGLGSTMGLTDFAQSFAFAEIGAVNAWRSVGAFQIHDLLEPDLHAIWRDLQTSNVAANTTHVKAIELASQQPIMHWLALPVSSVAPPFALQHDLIRQALGLVKR